MFFKYSKLVLLTKEHSIIIGFSRENPCDWLISCKVAPSGFTNEQLLNRTSITEQNPTSEPKNNSRVGTATSECSGDQGSVLFSFLQNLNARNAYLICKNGVSITTILEQWRHTSRSARILSKWYWLSYTMTGFTLFAVRAFQTRSWLFLSLLWSLP